MLTIEELREARQYSSSVLFCALGSVTDKNARENIANFFTLINTVLDAEIERQSVGDGDNLTVRVNALGESLQSQLDEFVYSDCGYGVYSGMHDEISELQEIAINALRAYQL